VKPPLSVLDTIALLRQCHPEALVCTECGRLLATTRKATANLSEAARLGFVCAECRSETTPSTPSPDAPKPKRATTRRFPLCLLNGAHTPDSPWAAECPLKDLPASPTPPSEPVPALSPVSGQNLVFPSPKSLISYGPSEGVLMTVQPLKREGAFFRTTQRGGRPRSGLTRQQQQREASRRYRRQQSRATAEVQA
jgi:hypothetical protein